MEKIKEFLKTNNSRGYGSGSGSGDGSGDGSGNGSGNGYRDGSGYDSGDGYGNGYGSGDGYGDGYGSGDGYGDDDGLKTFNNMSVNIIDSIQTIITSIKGNIAKGFVLQSDLTLESCYIAKGENVFAHGSTIKEAVDSLQKKLLNNLPIEKRIEQFNEKFSSQTKEYKAIEFYQWHFFLTGSCEMGRKSFCRDNNINLDKDKFTVKKFVELTENSYGSHVIKLLTSKEK